MEERKYKVNKGLQMPLVFMILKGKYILWAFASLIIGIFLCVLSILITQSNIVGGGVWVGSTLLMLSYIMICQNRGLYTKKKDIGIYYIDIKK